MILNLWILKTEEVGIYRRKRKGKKNTTLERNRREGGMHTFLSKFGTFFPLKSQGGGALHLPESARGGAPPPSIRLCLKIIYLSTLEQ